MSCGRGSGAPCSSGGAPLFGSPFHAAADAFQV